MHKFPYRWTLKDARFTKDKGKVFSCFACGGGSTMGYKLAGFDVIGCNEIDPRMNKVYVANHHPRLNYLAPIQEFKLRKDLPAELYNLDILDGSPPCSSFSMSGSREDGWGKEKKFKEGQAKQVLDTLFFDFIDLAKELQPKVVIAENVKGLLLGEAMGYVRRIYDEFDKAGYAVCHNLLDASKMGVPQNRERVFFTAIRKDLLQYIPQTPTLFEILPRIDFDYNERPIIFSEFADYQGEECVQKSIRPVWEKREYGDKGISDTLVRTGGKDSFWNYRYVYNDRTPDTLHSELKKFVLFDKPIYYSRSEVCNIATFPQDYDFIDQDFCYIAGMSVPPVMMAQVASRVYDQWLSKINK